MDYRVRNGTIVIWLLQKIVCTCAMQTLLESKKDDLGKICRELGIKKLYAFGSAVSGDFREDSDLDFLISFRDDLSIEEYTNNYFTLHYTLRTLFSREIDVVTDRALSNPYFIDHINQTKKLIYEAA